MSYVIVPGVGMVALQTTPQLLPGAVLAEVSADADDAATALFAALVSALRGALVNVL